MLDDPLHSAKILSAIGSPGVSDRDIVTAVDTLSFSGASAASPELVYGRGGWASLLAEDPEGDRARAKFDYDWNFGMSPRRRAEVAWRNGLADFGFDLVRTSDEATYAETKAVDAAHLESVRRRRRGGV